MHILFPQFPNAWTLFGGGEGSEWFSTMDLNSVFRQVGL